VYTKGAESSTNSPLGKKRGKELKQEKSASCSPYTEFYDDLFQSFYNENPFQVNKHYLLKTDKLFCTKVQGLLLYKIHSSVFFLKGSVCQQKILHESIFCM